jgi:phosphate transport system ATP-binding protein
MENPEQNTLAGLEAIPESATRQNVALPEPAAIAEGERAAQPAAGTGVPIFEVNGTSIYYGSFRAVTNVSLTIYEHQITAFIGPSGCGKTTVLRTLNRMNDLVVGARVEGEVSYRGENLYAKDVSPIAVRRRIGMVFQKPNPFPKSIYDNVAYGPRINGIRNKSELNEIVERSLRQAALWDEVKNRLGNSGLGLSGGQAQRLWIATGAIEDLMKEIKDKYTIVIVTHNMQQATRVSDRTAFFSVLVNPESDTRTGTLVEYAPTERLFGDPQDDRTKAYVTGRMG